MQKGRFARGRFFYVWVAARKDLEEDPTSEQATIGIVVNRKTQARATARNTLKRRVREIFRKRQNEIKSGTAILVKAKEGSEMPSLNEAEEEMLSLFSKTKALK